jgi:hypothetical protein
MKQLLENFSHCEAYDENSFTGIWHEKSLMDYAKYWKFEKCIFDLACINGGAEIPRDIAWPLTRIYSYIMISIQSHFDPNDGYEVSNLNQQDMYEFRQRFQEVFEGFFKGEMPNNEYFDIINPLLEST